jgi:molybdopterin/thiamine biosynthesis adenylyltransferase
VVLDCCDNFQTRQAVNAACVRAAKPLVSGAAIQMDGQIMVYDPSHRDAPCYACTFAPEQAPEEARCATMGVFAPLVGIIGAMQAAEALKLLAQTGQSLSGYLLLLDARTMEWTRLTTQRRAHCVACGAA